MEIEVLFFTETEDNVKDAILAVKDKKQFGTEELTNAIREEVGNIVHIEEEDFEDDYIPSEEEWEEVINKLSCGLPADWLDYEFYYETIQLH